MSELQKYYLQAGASSGTYYKCKDVDTELQRLRQELQRMRAALEKCKNCGLVNYDCICRHSADDA